MNDLTIERESWVAETQFTETAVYLLTHTKSVDVRLRLHQYADYICNLIHGRICQIELAQPKAADGYFFGPRPSDKPCDLIVFGEPDRSLVKRLLPRNNRSWFLNHLAVSLLVARGPRQPIKKILLLVRAEESDEAAVAWACRLAKNRDIQVTCLPIVPAQPGRYQYGKSVQSQENGTLAKGTATNKYINSFLRQLHRADIPYELNLQEGEPHAQIKRVLAADDPDLVIIAGEPYCRIQHLLLGEIITPLLHTLNRPMFIAVPAQAS